MAGWSVIVGGLLAFVLGGAAIGLVREQLHLNCSMGAPGSEGADTWTCSDGIGYIGIAVILGIMWFVVVLVGALIALLVRNDRIARLALVLLATLSVAWVVGWTWRGSATLVGDEYSPLTGAEYWMQAVGPAALTAAAGLTIGLLSLALPGRLSWAVGFAAALALIVATALQPGLSLNVLPAVGLLAAAATRGVGRESSLPRVGRTR